ncbi:MAG: BCAM0308 family protein [Armatimonadetes bacterium]|nr:BCAM0308 family protein [Armatimonadota bacterium]
MSDKPPVNIRNHAVTPNDPYLEAQDFQENTVCRQCGAFFAAGRWYMKGQHPGMKHDLSSTAHDSLCPACRRFRDTMPGGVLTLSGDFMTNHNDEILNLIRNETNDAMGINPLERIMSMEAVGGDFQITTTNDRLAQRIGKALHKAYNGNIEYKWSGDTKLARVNWHRD